MRIMLTGATGYVGGAIAARALGAGHAVGAITRPRSNTAQLEAMPGEKRLYPVSGTLESISAALLDFSPDCIIHVAALVSSDHAPQDVIPLVRSNPRCGVLRQTPGRTS